MSNASHPSGRRPGNALRLMQQHNAAIPSNSKDDSEALFKNIEQYLRHDKMNMSAPRVIRHYQRVLKKFVQQVHKECLFDQSAPAEKLLTREKFLAQRTRYFRLNNETSPAIERAFDDVFDVLYAEDISQFTPHFKSYLATTLSEKWEKGNYSEQKRHDEIRKILTDDIFPLNRHLLMEKGESLITAIKRHAEEGTVDAGDAYFSECLKQVAGGASTKRAKESLALYIDFILHEPENNVPREEDRDDRVYSARQRAMREEALPPAAPLHGQFSRFAEPDVEAAWRVKMKSQVSRRGNAEILKNPVELAHPPERIMIRCAGQGKYIYPFLQLYQGNSECLPYALAVFVLEGHYDFEVPPIPLALYKAREQEYCLAHYGKQVDQITSPHDRENIARAVLAQLNAQKTIPSLELLRYVTRDVDIDPNHPEGETYQALYYLRLLNIPGFPFPVRGGKALITTQDWKVLRALIDNLGGSMGRILVHQKGKGTTGGHFFTFLRDSSTRHFHNVDSKEHDQPYRKTPGSLIHKALHDQDAEEFELVLDDTAQQADSPGAHSINRALRFHQEVLMSAQYSQPAQALSDFVGANIGTWALHQFLSSDRQAAVPSGDMPVALGFSSEQATRDITPPDLETFLNVLGRELLTKELLANDLAANHLLINGWMLRGVLPNPQIATGWLAHPWPINEQLANALLADTRLAECETMKWLQANDLAPNAPLVERISASVKKLEDFLNQKEHLQEVILSGWKTSPYCIVARKRADGHWYIAREEDHSLSTREERALDASGERRERSIDEFFRTLQMPAEIPDITKTDLQILGWTRQFQLMTQNPVMAMPEEAPHVTNPYWQAIDWARQSRPPIPDPKMTIGEVAKEAAASITDRIVDYLKGEENRLLQAAADSRTETDSLFDGTLRDDESAVDPNPVNLSLPTRAANLALPGRTGNTRAAQTTSQIARALAGEYVQPNQASSGALGRQFNRKQLNHTTSLEVSDKLVLTRRNIVEMIDSGRVTIRPITEATGTAILERFAERAQTDSRYSHFVAGTPEENLETLRSAFRQGMERRYRPKPLVHHIVCFITGTSVQERAENGIMQPVTLQLLGVWKRVPGSLEIDIVDIDEATQPVLDEMDMRYGPAQKWKTRLLQMSGELFDRLKDELGDTLDAFDNATALCHALQEGLRRTGIDRPDPIADTLWCITVKAGEQDVRLLVNLRGTRILNLRQDNPDRLSEALEEATLRDKREEQIFKRIWQRDVVSGQPIERFRAEMSEAAGRYIGFFDAVRAIQAMDSADQLDDIEGTPLKRLEVLLDGDVPLAFCLLFDNGELIDAREDTGPERIGIMQHSINPRFEYLFNQAAQMLAGERDEPIGDDASTELFLHLAAHAREHGHHTFNDLSNAVLVRGSGTPVHKDYPDLRYHTLHLDSRDPVTGTRVTKAVDVIVRTSNAKRIEEIVLNRPENKNRMLAYHIPARDAARILRRDNDPRNRVSGYEHGELMHMAKLDRISRHDPEDNEPPTLDDVSAIAYLRKTISRGNGRVVHPAYPEIMEFRTEYRDLELVRPIEFLARIHNSSIVDPVISTLPRFYQMTWKRSDVGLSLQQVKNRLGNRFTAEHLEAMLQPGAMDEYLPDPAFPSWRRFHIGDGQTLLGKVRDNEIVKIIEDKPDAFDAERTYWLPLSRREHILALDKKNNNFLERHRADGQTKMEFVTQHLRRENPSRTNIPGWPQLHTFVVPSRQGGHVTLLARIEDGEIWDAVEDSGPARDKLQKNILRDRMEDSRRISRAEAARLARESMPLIVQRLLERQKQQDNAQTRAIMRAKDQDEIIRHIARRENRAELERMQLPDALRAHDHETLASLGGNVTELLESLIDGEDWEPVRNRPEMRQYDSNVRDENGELLKIFAYFNLESGRLIDARIGTEKGLAELDAVRKKNLDSLPTVAGSWFSREEIQEIYLRDHTVRNKKLMQLADIADMNFPKFLHTAIPKPVRKRDGSWSYPKGEEIHINGMHSELFRRYRVPTEPGKPPAEMLVIFDPVRDANGNIVNMRLADVSVAPPPRHKGFQISLPLLAQIRYLEKHEATIELPDLDPQNPIPPMFPGAGRRPSVSASPRRPGASGDDWQSNEGSGLFVPDPQHILYPGEGFEMPGMEGMDFDYFAQGDDLFAGMDLDVGLDNGQMWGDFLFSDLNVGHQNAMNIESLFDMDRFMEDAPSEQTMNAEGFVDSRMNLDVDPAHAMLQGAHLFEGLNPGFQNVAGVADMPSHLQGLHPSLSAGWMNEMDVEGLLNFDNLMEDVPVAQGAPADPSQFDFMQQDVPAENEQAAVNAAEPANPGRAPEPNLEDFNFDEFSNFHIYRVELPPDPVLEEFLPEVRKTYGKPTYQSLADLLFPDGHTEKFNRRLQEWVQAATDPQFESDVAKDTPELRRFTTTLPDGKPLTFLGQLLKNGTILAPWNDTKDTEKFLIDKIKRESPSPEERKAIKNKEDKKPPLDAHAAKLMVQKLQLSDQQIDALLLYLLSDRHRESVLAAICKQAGIQGKPGDFTNIQQALRDFLMQGMEKALVGKRAPVRLLVIPTSVEHLNRPVKLHVSLARGGIKDIWIPEQAKSTAAQKAARHHIKLEEQLSIDHIVRLNTRKVKNRTKRKELPETSEASLFQPPSRKPRVDSGFAETTPQPATAPLASRATPPAPSSTLSRVQHLHQRQRSVSPDSHANVTTVAPAELLAQSTNILKRKATQEQTPDRPQKRAKPDTFDTSRQATPVTEKLPSPRASQVTENVVEQQMETDEEEGLFVSDDDSLFVPDDRSPTPQAQEHPAEKNTPLTRTELMAGRRSSTRSQSTDSTSSSDSDTLFVSNRRKRESWHASQLRASLASRVVPITEDASRASSPAPTQGNQPPSVVKIDSRQQALRLSVATAAPGSKEAAGIEYNFNQAKSHWTSKRVVEFDEIRKAKNRVEKLTGKDELSGVRFLMYLSKLCDQAIAQPTTKQIDSEGKIFEFEVEPYTGAKPLTIWRLVDGNGTVSLRCAPAANAVKDRDRLQKTMLDLAKNSASRRMPKIENIIPYSARDAQHHWVLEARAAELQEARQICSQHYGIELSGGTFLKHLSALCDKEDATNNKTEIHRQGKVFEYTVAIHEGGPSITLWRRVYRVDGKQVIKIRRAPDLGDEHAAVLQSMVNYGKKESLIVTLKVGSRLHEILNPLRARQFEASLKEFGETFSAWKAASHADRSAGEFRMHLFDLCEKEHELGHGLPIDEEEKIHQYTIVAHSAAKPIDVWRVEDGHGGFVIRLAPPSEDTEAREELRDSLLNAVLGIDDPVETNGGEFPDYDPDVARAHWGNEKRAAAFDDMREQWIKAAKLRTKPSGPVFLRRVYALCNKEHKGARGIPVDQEGKIIEYQVAIHRKVQPVAVWRLVNELGHIILWPAPAADDAKAREELQRAMFQVEENRISHATKKETGDFPYEYKFAQYHWTGPREREFNDIMLDWCTVKKIKPNGGVFLMHLHAECGKTEGRPVAKDSKILEFSIRTHLKAKPIRVWRLIADNAVSLRLAPPAGDKKASQELQDEMLKVARNNAARRAPQSDAPVKIDGTLRRWVPPRSDEFEGMLQEWNALTEKDRSGMALLEHLAGICQTAIAKGEGTKIGKDGKILAFNVKTHPQATSAEIWWLKDKKNSIDLRLAPAQNDKKKRAALEKAMLTSERNSSAKMMEKITSKIGYTRIQAKSQWNDVRAAEFGDIKDAWSEWEGSERSGGALLLKLSEECDKAEEDEKRKGIVIDDDGDGIIKEYTVATHPSAESVDVWRLVDGKGTISLRRAPPKDDQEQRDKLKKKMLHGAVRSASKVASGLRRKK